MGLHTLLTIGTKYENTQMDVMALILWYYYWALTLKSMSCQHFFQQNHIPETCIITKYKFAEQHILARNAFLHSLKKWQSRRS